MAYRYIVVGFIVATLLLLVISSAKATMNTPEPTTWRLATALTLLGMGRLLRYRRFESRRDSATCQVGFDELPGVAAIGAHWGSVVKPLLGMAMAALVVVASPFQSVAVDYTWNGSQNHNFAVRENWSPANPSRTPDSRDTVYFGPGNPQRLDQINFFYRVVNGQVVNEEVNGIRFQNTSQNILFNISGDHPHLRMLTVGGGGITIFPNYSGSEVEMRLPLNLAASQTWNVASAGASLHISRGINLNGHNVGLSGSGTVVLSGVVTGPGAIVFNGGNLRVGDNGFSSTSGLAMGTAGTINTSGNSASFSGALTGSGNLTKRGTGKLTLTGDSPNYTGKIIVEDGILEGTANAIRGNVTNNTNVSFVGGGTYSGAMIGSGVLVKSGGDTLTLTANNSYIGNTIINGGILSGSTLLNNGFDSSFGRGNFLMSNGGTLQYTGGTTITNRMLTLNAGGGGISVTNSSTMLMISGGFVSGVGSLTKTGAGTLRLNNSNSYAGGTIINGGVVSGSMIFNNGTDSAFGRGNFSMSNGGILEYTGETTSTNRTMGLNAGGGAINVSNGSTTLTMSGIISGSGSLTKLGAGSLVLSGNNTYAGTTTVNSGGLHLTGTNLNAGGIILNSANLLANYASLGSGTLTINGGWFSITSDASGITNSINIIGTGAAIDTQGRNPTFFGTVSGSGNLHKVSGGNLYLAGNNINFSGETRVIAGGIMVQHFNALSGSTVNLAAGEAGQLLFHPTIASANLGGLTGSRNLTLQRTNAAPITVSIGNNNSNQTYSGVLSGAGSLTKIGTGTLTLSGNNNFNGTTTISQGTLQVGNGGGTGTLGTGNTSIAAGANLTFNRGGSYTYGGTIGGPGSLTKTGIGTVILTTNNSYGATTISQGTLQIGIGGGMGTLGSGNTSIAAGANLTFSRNDTHTYNGVISGDGSLTKTGTGILTLTGNNSYGATTINQGTLQIGNGGGTGTLGTGNTSIAAGANLTFNRGGSYTYGGTIGGPGSLTKTGTGTLMLSGSNNYTGATMINAGTLAVGSTLHSQTISVTNGAILASNNFQLRGGQTLIGGQSGGGFGNVITNQFTLAPGSTVRGKLAFTGNVTNSGAIKPGFSPEIITINGNYTQTADGLLQIEFGGLTPGPTGHDQLVVSGSASLAGRLEVPLINNFVPQVGDEITFLTAGSLNGFFHDPVAPNLDALNQTIKAQGGTELAFQAIYNYDDDNVKLRVVEKSDDNIFWSVFKNAEWTSFPSPGDLEASWSTGVLPSSADVIEINNLYSNSGELQTLGVNIAQAAVNQLTVRDANSPIEVLVKSNNTLTSQTGITIGENGILKLESDSLLHGASITVQDGGILGGKGTVAVSTLNNNKLTVKAGGIVSPGSSAGHLDVEGNYLQETGGTLLVEIDGTQEGEWDTLNISGEATLGGTLTIDASNLPMNIAPGTRFEIITAGNLAADTFDSIETIGNNGLVFRGFHDIDMSGGGSFSVEVDRSGDMDGSGGPLTQTDMDLFVFALMNPVSAESPKWNAKCPQCDIPGVGFWDPTYGGDFNNNGRIDFDDIAGFQNRMAELRMSSASLTAAFERYFSNVPEPTSGMLVAIYGLFASLTNLRRRGHKPMAA